ncbi:MAG: O-antigen ligase family protein [Pseudomonadota bacterium]
MTRDDMIGWFGPLFLLGLNALIMFWLIVTSGAIFPLLALGDGAELDAATRGRLRLLLLPSLALAPLLLIMRLRAIVSLALRNTSLMILVIWAAISIVWSIAPELTGRRAFGLVVNTTIACYLVVDRDVDKLLRMLAWCFLILMIANAAFIVGLPDLAKMPDGRGIRGAFLHKNSVGETAVIGQIVFYAALRSGAVSRPVGLLGMALSLGLLVIAGAASSIVVGAAILGLQLYFLTDVLAFRQRAVIFAFGLAACIVVAGVLFANIEDFLGALGRDTTLTGRTDIWAYVIKVSAQRPWLGYGYAGFFESTQIAQYMQDAYQWSIPTAHNGYLEMVLGLGWIGFALLLTFFLVVTYRLTVNWQSLPIGVRLLALPMLIYYILLNFTESTILASSGLGWLVMVIAALLLTPGLSVED